MYPLDLHPRDGRCVPKYRIVHAGLSLPVHVLMLLARLAFDQGGTGYAACISMRNAAACKDGNLTFIISIVRGNEKGGGPNFMCNATKRKIQMELWV